MLGIGFGKSRCGPWRSWRRRTQGSNENARVLLEVCGKGVCGGEGVEDEDSGEGESEFSNGKP